jgi:hypothetical protein
LCYFCYFLSLFAAKRVKKVTKEREKLSTKRNSKISAAIFPRQAAEKIAAKIPLFLISDNRGFPL